MKNSIITKVINRQGRSVLSIAKEVGIPQTTIVGWMKKRDNTDPVKKSKSSHKWSAERKLKVLMETASLSESELGAYLRKEGLFSQQLDEWKAEFLSSMDSSKKAKPAKDDRDQKIKSLEREILRKDKALAEASALLILQKKVNLIWGNSDEDEK